MKYIVLLTATLLQLGESLKASFPGRRRDFLSLIPSTGLVAAVPLVTPQVAHAKKPEKLSKEAGRNAAQEIVKTQQAVREAEKLAATESWDKLTDLLNDPVMTSFEENILKVTNSEGLLEQDYIKEIGTIRRYGLAADYMIMAGGAKSELNGDEDGVINGKEVKRLLKLATGSIDEIIGILKSAKAI